MRIESPIRTTRGKLAIKHHVGLTAPILQTSFHSCSATGLDREPLTPLHHPHVGELVIGLEVGEVDKPFEFAFPLHVEGEPARLILSGFFVVVVVLVVD